MSEGSLAIAIGVVGLLAAFVMARVQQRAARNRGTVPTSTLTPCRRKLLMVGGLTGFVLWLGAAAATGVAIGVAGGVLTSAAVGVTIGCILWWAFFTGLAVIIRRRAQQIDA